MAYRLGLDIGSNSIGWCCLSLSANNEPIGIKDAGVRIFADGRNPKDGRSLAAARREPRSMRRRRDRYLRRRSNLLNALTRFGLMPAEDAERRLIAKRDPYALRDEALHRRLDPHELGRVIFHLNQRRGFKSNRKVDRTNAEVGPVKAATAHTKEELARAGHATLGAWLAERHARGEEVRVRMTRQGRMTSYPFYPSRDLVEAEFDAVWATQAQWNPALTEDARSSLRHIIFHQRPLRPPVVGRCWLEPAEERAARAMPTAQRFRIAQTLAHLRLSIPGEPERPLEENERQILSTRLCEGRDMSFDQVRKVLKLPAETDFNSRENKLAGDVTATRLGAKRLLDVAWHRFDLDHQDAVVGALLDAEDDAEAIAALLALGLTQSAAEAVAGIALVEGHAALSLVAQRRILPHLEAGLRYSDAVQAAGYAHHSDSRTGELRGCLPYYGELLAERIGTGSAEVSDSVEKRFGRAPNPTVHVALNELRRVVNAITARHGPPAEIVVETLRELGRSAVQRRKKEQENRQNRDANDRRRKILSELGLPINSGNLMRLRLWEEQAVAPKDRCCPITGTLITPRLALSDAIEVDHILPFAMTLDDSAANRVLVTREANRAKAKRTPWQAFGHAPQWPEIVQRVALLPSAKRWRFEPGAEQRFAQDGDFLARHLTDSATIARWAVFYLGVLVPPGRIWSVPGRLTSLLRNAWGLNADAVLGRGGPRKDRTDHRHHAIDAVVVALTDRAQLQKVTRAAKSAEEAGERLLVKLDPPWPGLVAELRVKLKALVVSHKPDSGWQAALHNDTAYGPITNPSEGGPNVVVRRPLDTLADWSPDDARKHVRDPVLAECVAQALAVPDKAARKAALAAITDFADHQVHRVRTVERLESMQPIRDRRTGKPYKLVKRDSNHRCEIWRLPSGELKMQVVATFDAAAEAEARRLGRKPPDLRPHPAAKLLLRLHKNDMVAFGGGAERRILHVVKMSGGQIILAPHQESGALKARDADRNDPFKYVAASLRALRDNQARKLWVDPAGRVVDPGPAF